MTQGEWIRESRRALGWTLDDAADELYTAPSTISRWERDQCSMPLLKFLLLCEVTGQDPAAVVPTMWFPKGDQVKRRKYAGRNH